MTAAQPDQTGHTTLPHRFGKVSVTVLGADGQPLSNREVIVEQRAHAFSFGNIGFDFIPVANEETDPPRSAFGGASPDRAARIADLWFDLFNTATLPFTGAPSNHSAGNLIRGGCIGPQSGSSTTAARSRDTRWCGTR